MHRGHIGGMICGYGSVSTDARDLTTQLAQLKGAGCERIFREKTGGATADRPQARREARNGRQGLPGTMGYATP